MSYAMKPKPFRAVDIMTNNCWKMHGWNNPEDMLSMEYRAQFTGHYYPGEVAALVVETDGGLLEYGHYGVVRLEVYYSPNPPYEWYELDDAQKAIELAEDNLLRIGIPFSPTFEFHGKNRANKSRRNFGLRRKYGLPSLESARIHKLEREDDYK